MLERFRTSISTEPSQRRITQVRVSGITTTSTKSTMGPSIASNSSTSEDDSNMRTRMSISVDNKITPSGGREHQRSLSRSENGTTNPPRPKINRHQRQMKRKSKLSRSVHLMHRMTIFAAAVMYLETSLQAAWSTWLVLQGDPLPTRDSFPYVSPLMQQVVGTELIRHSPLMQLLNSDTTPRNGTLYLDEDGYTSYENCSNVELPDGIYGDPFLRSLYDAIVRDVAYNLTFLQASENELILPVVDCTFTSILNGDTTASKFFYLVRKRLNADDVYLLIVALSNQEYMIDSQKEHGPAGVATINFINDMRSNDVQHHFAIALGYPFELPEFQVYTYQETTQTSYWILESVPFDSTREIPKVVRTACRTGFYVTSETEQANIKNEVWTLYQDAQNTVGTWQWSGNPILRDSWTWVHIIQLLFGLNVLINLLLLLLVIVRNFQAGKLWIGDAFVSISTSLLYRGVLVFMTWWLNGFWTFYEFCLYDGNMISEAQSIFIHEDIAKADIMNIYLSFAGLVGFVLRERVDPALSILLFEVGFRYRDQIIQWVPSFVDLFIEVTNTEYIAGIAEADARLSIVSPMRLWCIHPQTPRDLGFAMTVLFPIFITFVIILIYVLLRKIYRRFVPEEMPQKITTVSETEELALKQKHNLTLFEIATGAALDSQFGLVSDYQNYVFFKGLKYASADGVYSSGFVIANKKFLIQMDDLGSIWIMKIARVRYRNVYAYEIMGNTVQQTARLIYPKTLTYQDLVNLNVNVLA